MTDRVVTQPVPQAVVELPGETIIEQDAVLHRDGPAALRLVRIGGGSGPIHFFHHEALDHMSCSPFRVPVTRLEAGRAALDIR